MLDTTSSNTFSSVQLLNQDNYINLFLGFIILILIIMLLFNMCSYSNKKYKNIKKNKTNYKDVIVFYLADWCPHCQKIKPFIKETSKQSNVKFIIINANDLTEDDKEIIRAFPTALRKSDNKIAEGEIEIKKLVNETLNEDDLETFEVNINDKEKEKVNVNDSKKENDTVIFYVSKSCSYCQKLQPYINNLKNEPKINIKVINDNELTSNDNIDGFPTAIRKSDGKVALGGEKIMDLVEETINNKTKLTLIYSQNCNFSTNILPFWLKLKNSIIDYKLNLISEEYDLDNLPVEYKKNLKVVPTLFINGEKRFEGYDDILSYIDNYCK
jgi:thiol-disulfide isomerase/thioredoxin